MCLGDLGYRAPVISGGCFDSQRYYRLAMGEHWRTCADLLGSRVYHYRLCYQSPSSGFFDAGNWGLAEATLSATMRLFASGENLDLINTYLIFGDPALRMNNPYDFQVSPSTDEVTVLPGSIVEYSLHLSNSGLVPDSFSVTVNGTPNWPVTYPHTVSQLQPGEDADLVISVHTSLYAPDGATESIQLDILSHGDSGHVIPITLTTNIHLPGDQLVIYLPQIVK